MPRKGDTMTNDQITLKEAPINWQCKGKFRFSTGYGATKAESAIANYAAFIAPVLLYVLVWKELDWSGSQIVVAAILTLDMIGGVLTNSLGSMKRYLHANQNLDVNWLGRLVGSKFLFPAIHFQLFLVPLCFDIVWSYAFFWYGMMMVSIAIVHFTPLYLQRPVALLIVMLSIIVAQIIPSPAGLEWLAPIFMIKLVLSHGVREEPYRPTLTE
ncbi:membrane protein (plasmid) [Vibrio coralliilyticus]|uniref:Membrane protein n=2 Tax=Vibrio coralliilyticus TaxID=190893 RepID=A0AAN0SKX6_9VIBR|nr:membrane protein [Vibrio coralliilyticus]